MVMRLFIAFSIAFLAASVFAQAYRWVDEEGIVHYTDKPTPGAERIELPSDNRVPARRIAPVRATPTPDVGAGEFEYERLEVASPAAEETLWNIEGVLDVTLDLRPALQAGHQLRVYFDGNPRMVDGTSFQLQEVWRGVHNLQAEVVDGTGKLMIRSTPNRFYVQQNTVIRNTN
ncbi:MAG: DUF4124 domain-containing protein [Woeseia sp.]